MESPVTYVSPRSKFIKHVFKTLRVNYYAQTLFKVCRKSFAGHKVQIGAQIGNHRPRKFERINNIE